MTTTKQKLIGALFLLREAANQALRDVEAGRMPNLHTVGQDWKTVEAVVIQLDQESSDANRM